MTIRIMLAGIMFFSVFVWWWAGALFALALSLRYRAWEAIIFGVLLDILWLPSGAFHGVPVATCIALVSVWALEPLRRQFLFDYD